MSVVTKMRRFPSLSCVQSYSSRKAMQTIVAVDLIYDGRTFFRSLEHDIFRR
jgi:hypothetical protein